MIDIGSLKSEYQQLQNTYKNDSHIVLFGTEKLFLSAPHATDQIRNNKIKLSEEETAYICLYLNKYYNIPCIIKLHNKNDDANYDLESEYKNDLIKVLKTNKVTLFVDLHEMKYNRFEDICFGTADDNNSNLLNFNNIINDFIDCFNCFKVVSINSPFHAKSPGTNAKFVSSKINIPSVQIEISSRHLSTFRNATESDFEKVISSILKINEIINKISKN